MHSVLENNWLFFREHRNFLNAVRNHDVYDLYTLKLVMQVREPNLGVFSKLFRFTNYKRMTPFHFEVTNADGDLIMEVKRGTTVMGSNVEVLDDNGRIVGSLKRQYLSEDGKLQLLNANGEVLCSLKGKWYQREYKFVNGYITYGYVTKNWQGIGKELLTRAEDHVLIVDEALDHESDIRYLMLAAVICMDMVLR